MFNNCTVKICFVYFPISFETNLKLNTMKKTKRLSIIEDARNNTYTIVLNGVKLTSVHNSMLADNFCEIIEKAIDTWDATHK